MNGDLGKSASAWASATFGRTARELTRLTFFILPAMPTSSAEARSVALMTMFACGVAMCYARLVLNRISSFFLRPITLRDTAAEVGAFAHVLGILAAWLGLALLGLAAAAAGVAVLAHLPTVFFVGLALWALMNGRLFSMIFCFMLSIAWFNWLRGISPL